jgi:hypothetical protein
VKVKFLKPDEYIRPDMNARVTFLEPNAAATTSNADQKLLVVPKRAVLERESGLLVMVVSEGRVQAKPITVQKEVNGNVFVSSGLAGNEAIIVGEQLQQLKVGDKVEVTDVRRQAN